jgi:hypothetical protein
MHPLTTSFYLPSYVPQDTESDFIYDVHPKKVVGQSYDLSGFIGVSQQSRYYATDQLFCGVMASNTGIFDRAHPVYVSGDYTQDELFNQITLLDYQDQRFKQAQVEQNGDINIVYPATVFYADPNPANSYYQVALLRQTIGSVYHVSPSMDIAKVLARGAIGNVGCIASHVGTSRAGQRPPLVGVFACSAGFVLCYGGDFVPHGAPRLFAGRVLGGRGADCCGTDRLAVGGVR